MTFLVKQYTLGLYETDPKIKQTKTIDQCNGVLAY